MLPQLDAGVSVALSNNVMTVDYGDWWENIDVSYKAAPGETATGWEVSFSLPLLLDTGETVTKVSGTTLPARINVKPVVPGAMVINTAIWVQLDGKPGFRYARTTATARPRPQNGDAEWLTAKQRCEAQGGVFLGYVLYADNTAAKGCDLGTDTGDGWGDSMSPTPFRVTP